MNAVESAPSANRSRSRFGARKAVRKASYPVPAPKRLENIWSRANPSTRLHITASPTIPVARMFPVGWEAGDEGRDTRGRCQNPTAGPPAQQASSALLLATTRGAGLLAGHTFVTFPARTAATGFLLGGGFLFRRSFGCHISCYENRRTPDVPAATVFINGLWGRNPRLPGATVP